MDNKTTLESLAMDLKRVAMGYQRNSLKMATRFYEEARKRKNEVDMTKTKPYINNVLSKIELLDQENNEKKAEDALMYSTLIINYTQTFL
jgi:glutamine amidotransferase PdxT